MTPADGCHKESAGRTSPKRRCGQLQRHRASASMRVRNMSSFGHLLVRLWYTALIVAIIASACSGGDGETLPEQEVGELKIEVTSSAFGEGDAIPMKHTCDGEDTSPPLRWSGVPEGTRSLALIADDPDAPGGTWVHWVLYGIPQAVTELEEGIPTTETLPDGAKQGTTDFQEDWLRRALSAARARCPPLLFQGLRAGRRDRSGAEGFQE